ncbi:hypothetical protein BCR34DRAFT_651936 [Clohesyomyces aquaticus]|uniref:Uncharacterized protein n=1 Tax=Clohesyomyces aquaticus TaxID=1231657 RepID=A0A1Y1ZNW5_9PLEO|nr:hypothetical protein BCR34DRAFT_651936 [Clohesyomyces aquaticus]
MSRVNHTVGQRPMPPVSRKYRYCLIGRTFSKEGLGLPKKKAVDPSGSSKVLSTNLNNPETHYLGSSDITAFPSPPTKDYPNGTGLRQNLGLPHPPVLSSPPQSLTTSALATLTRDANSSREMEILRKTDAVIRLEGAAKDLGIEVPLCCFEPEPWELHDWIDVQGRCADAVMWTISSR